MIYDYFKENNSYVSLWLGNFPNQEKLNSYLQTVYWEDESEAEFQQKLDCLFLQENRDRPEESELRELFDECYNHFEYDFGLSFDSDFSEISHSAQASCSSMELLRGHSYFGSFRHLIENTLSKPFNSALLIYDCCYDGHIRRVSHSDFELTFIDIFPFSKEDRLYRSSE